MLASSVRPRLPSGTYLTNLSGLVEATEWKPCDMSLKRPAPSEPSDVVLAPTCAACVTLTSHIIAHFW